MNQSDGDRAKAIFFASVKMLDAGQSMASVDGFNEVLALIPGHQPSHDNRLIAICRAGLINHAIDILGETTDRNISDDGLSLVISSIETEFDFVAFAMMILRKSLDRELTIKTLVKLLNHLINTGFSPQSSQILITKECNVLSAEIFFQLVIEEKYRSSKLITNFVGSIDIEYRQMTEFFPWDAYINAMHGHAFFYAVTQCYGAISNPQKLNIISNRLVIDSALKTGKVSLAQEINHLILERDPLSVEDRLAQADIFAASGSVATALQYLEAFSDQEKESNIVVVLAIAKYLSLAERHDESLELLESINIKTKEDSALVSKVSALTSLFAGKYGEALKFAITLYESRGAQPGVLKLLAECFLATNDLEPGFKYLATSNNVLEDDLVKLKNEKNWVFVANQGIGDQLLLVRLCEKITGSNELKNSSQLHPKLRFLIPFSELNEQWSSVPISAAPYLLFARNGPKEFADIFQAETDRRENNSSIKSPNELINEAFEKTTKQSLTIGVCLGSTSADSHDQKTVSWNKLLDYFDQPWVKFICLDYKKESIRAAEDCDDQRVSRIAELDTFEDVEGTLSILRTCDYVLCGSNSYAHLAGYVGLNTLLFVPNGYGRLWYWRPNFIDQTSFRSLIYPSVAIYDKSILETKKGA
jgi:tetratricopeptide (TPR) repeat protein